MRKVSPALGNQAALFVAQGDDGIDASGAARGKITRGNADQRQEKRHSHKGSGIGSAYAVEKSSQQACEHERADQPGRNTEESDARAFADDAAKNIAGLR